MFLNSFKTVLYTVFFIPFFFVSLLIFGLFLPFSGVAFVIFKKTKYNKTVKNSFKKEKENSFIDVNYEVVKDGKL